MEKEYILTGKTVEEAMSEARKQYGAEDKELSFEILEMPKKGFLGIGASPARVKVTVADALEDVNLYDLVLDLKSKKRTDADEKPQAKPQQKPQREQNHNQPAKPKNPEKNPEKKQEKKPADDVPAALRPVVKNASQQGKAQTQKPAKSQNNRPADNRPAAEKKKDLLSAVMGIKDSAPVKKLGDKIEDIADKIEDTFDDLGDKIEDKFESIGDKVEDKIDEMRGKKEARKDTKRMEFVTPQEMEFALEFANTLLQNMQIPAKAVHDPDPRGETVPEGMVPARIEIVGDDSGILIGYHGETLDAIQYLVNLCASRKSESSKREFVKIVVDIEGYRAKREETLRALARRMAAKAVKYKRNMVLEPMNPYERRIIHSEVQDIENVSTHSVGSDENRKIVITYEGADKVQSGRRTKSDRRGKKSRGEKPARREETAETTEIRETPVRAERPERDLPRKKPVRAKSIDEIRLDLSEESTVTLGSIGEADENLREY